MTAVRRQRTHPASLGWLATMLLGVLGATAPLSAATAASQVPKIKAAADLESPNEASGDGDGPALAEDITKGIRIEDIIEPPTDYHYAAFGRPDPFMPPMVLDREGAGPNPLEIPIVSPLQRYSLDQLRVVGIWRLASGDRKAMVLAQASRSSEPGRGGTDSMTASSAASQGIIVKVGDPIGNRGGKVMSVADDYVTIREFSLSPDGSRQYEDRQLPMGARNADELPGKIIFTPGKKATAIKIDGVGVSTDGGGSPAAGAAPLMPRNLPTQPGGALPMPGASSLAPAATGAPTGGPRSAYSAVVPATGATAPATSVDQAPAAAAAAMGEAGGAAAPLSSPPTGAKAQF